MMHELRAREEICRVGRSLFERGYAHATAGNISMRLEDGYLITPTDACLGFLDPVRVAKVDHAGHQLAGDRASKTLTLHRHIYAADPDAMCVIHTHSTHLVALSLMTDTALDSLIPPITPYFVMKVGPVPLLPYYRPGSQDVGEEVAATIDRFRREGRPIRSVMLSRLGPNVWHRTPAEAMSTLEELEETARLHLLAGARTAPLSQAALKELEKIFGAHWS